MGEGVGVGLTALLLLPLLAGVPLLVIGLAMRGSRPQASRVLLIVGAVVAGAASLGLLLLVGGGLLLGVLAAALVH